MNGDLIAEAHGESATFLFGTKKMPESHALSKFLYQSTLPTPVSPEGEGAAELVHALHIPF